MAGRGFIDWKSNTVVVLMIALLLCSSGFETCRARGGKHLRHKSAAPRSRFIHSGQGNGGGHRGRWDVPKFTATDYTGSQETLSAAAAATPQGGNSEKTFNVLDYGAKGDGRTDDTKAFEATWAAACKVQASTMLVPSGSVFLVGPVSFSGANCAANVVFQLEGKIIAPTSASPWGSGLLQWIDFIDHLQGITIQGAGTIDGQGAVWWTGNEMPSTKPTAVRFYGSSHVAVTGITIQNSPQTHLKFDACNNVEVHQFTASSPGTSPNTDGIHLQNSGNVHIYSCTLACGDDCISIQTGCSNVYTHDVNCGPGHGISIGGLGYDNSKACVSNITVRHTTMKNTLAGVRIKTWQGGSGSVKGITFSNIQVAGVETPIVIDQFYCNNGKCKNASSAVAISGINYANIQGTYTSNPVHFACSDNWPCTGISLDTIDLSPAGEESQPFCWNAYGELIATTVPPVNCLKAGSSKSPSVSC